MKLKAGLAIALLAQQVHVQAEAGSWGTEPWETEFEMGQLESVQGPGPDPLVWDFSASISSGAHSFSALSEGERVEGALDANEFRLQYGHAMSDLWSAKIGLRKDTGTGPHQEWLELGFERQMAYAVDTAVSAFVDKDGNSAIRIEAEKAIEVAPRWLLVPEMTANIYGYNDEATGAGSGLSDLELAARLAYEVTSHSAVYVGALWGRAYGQAAEYVRQEGDDVDEARAVIGITAWF